MRHFHPQVHLLLSETWQSSFSTWKCEPLDHEWLLYSQKLQKHFKENLARLSLDGPQQFWVITIIYWSEIQDGCHHRTINIGPYGVLLFWNHRNTKENLLLVYMALWWGQLQSLSILVSVRNQTWAWMFLVWFFTRHIFFISKENQPGSLLEIVWHGTLRQCRI